MIYPAQVMRHTLKNQVRPLQHQVRIIYASGSGVPSFPHNFIISMLYWTVVSKLASTNAKEPQLH